MIAALIGLCMIATKTGSGDVTQETFREAHGGCLVLLQNRLCHIIILCHIILIRCSLTKFVYWGTDQATGKLLSAHSATQHGVAEAIPSSSKSFGMVDTMAG